jgi:hypothetical protein
MARVSPQVLVFSYHKTGTSLFLHVMTKVSRSLGLTLDNRFGLVTDLSPEPDIALLPHSLLRCRIDWPYQAVRLIRDPRDIWVSGYLYHRHSDEEWCISTDHDPTPPIDWPRVDHALTHRSEDWKRGWLERLGGRSYQQNLLDRPTDEGLAWELDGYTATTLEAMRGWPENGVTALDIRLEEVVADFDGTLSRVFTHVGFDAEQCEIALQEARSEDVNRMDDAAIASRPQIHSRTISKWREVLTPARIEEFETRYGDLVRDLGYGPAGVALIRTADMDDWTLPGPPPLQAEAEEARLAWPMSPDPEVQAPLSPRTGEAADVWLSVDGMVIRPTVVRDDARGFVVPANARHVRVESERSVSVDPGLPYVRAGRGRGVKINAIEIRSRAGELVIPADDPRLVAGWYGIEREGRTLWRWTDGSAEVPWQGVEGPAVVMVRCTTLGGYPMSGTQ